jgi:hypothetical protein
MEFIKNLLGFTNQVGGSLKVGDRVVEKYNHKHGAITLLYQSGDRTLFRMIADDGGIHDRSEENFAIESEWEANKLTMEAERVANTERRSSKPVAQSVKELRYWKVNDRYRNKFTGKEGIITESIEQNAWMCIEEGEYVCLYEAEMISVSEPIPFITNFKGDSVVLKENGNTSVDFIKGLLNDYLSRSARIAFQNKLLTEDDLRRIGNECSKPFKERSLTNIINIKLVSILTSRYDKIINMLISWSGFHWVELKNQYEANIRSKGGDEFNSDSFFVLIIEAFYNRIIAIIKISKACSDVKSGELSPPSPLSDSSSTVLKPSSTPFTFPSASLFSSHSARHLSTSRLPPLHPAQNSRPLVGVSSTFNCSNLELFSRSIVSFETITVESKSLGVPRMEAPGILWEMIGKHVLTDVKSLHLFRFDSTGKSAFQDSFFTRFDMRITGYFKNDVPCICIEGGNKILAFAHWVITNREYHRIKELRRLQTQELAFYGMFKSAYTGEENICLVIDRIYQQIAIRMEPSIFKELLELNSRECLAGEEQRRLAAVQVRLGSEHVRLGAEQVRLREARASRRLPIESELSLTYSPSPLSSATRSESRRLREPLMQSPFGSLLHPSVQATRVLEVPRGPFEVRRGHVEVRRGEMSVKPLGRIIPTREESHDASGRLKQSFFDSIPSRK